MELGHILWPSDPVTRKFSDPETPLTRWPCSIMNSKICRLMMQTNVCNGQEVANFYRCLAFARFWKAKFWRSFIKCQYVNDGWTDFHKIYIYIYLYLYLGLFSKTGKKTRVSHRVKMMTRWPVDPDVKDDPNDPLTRWSNDPVLCLVWILIRDILRLVCL